MAKDINGTPNTGTPNTGTVIHQEFNFHGEVHNVNPAATTVTTIINNGVPREAAGKHDDCFLDKAAVREEIIDYAYRLRDKYKKEWRPYVKQLWSDIVSLPAVEAEIYDRGRQKGTNFDRNLVGNIICFLNGKNLFEAAYNKTEFKRILMDGETEGQSVREALAYLPSDDIKEAIENLLANKKYF